MHELSIAGDIADIISAEVESRGGGTVTSVDLEIGKLSGIETESLRFALDYMVKDSILKNAEFRIHEIPATAYCNHCSQTFGIQDFWDNCPDCESHDISIVKGKEMKIMSFTIEEPDEVNN